MSKKREKEFVKLAADIAAAELGKKPPIPDEEMARILLENHFSLGDLLLLDELIYKIVEKGKEDERKHKKCN